MRVVCAMSGGVDSSVAAATLVKEGHEVIGMTMRLYDADEAPKAGGGKGGTCCSPAEIHRAKRVCNLLGIPHYTVDERAPFQERVIDTFVQDYLSGRTPNPCARCNQHIKFGPLIRRATGLGADVLATGHYARIVDGTLHRGVDPEKDQSYFLFAMGAERLSKVRFPLGALNKTEVRAQAQALGMPNWDAPDSQELCFVPGGDHGEVVERRAAELGLDTSSLQPGKCVDEDGVEVGDHRGVHRVTVGQRRGLQVAGTERRYALRVIPETNTVVVGASDRLGVARMSVGELQRLSLGEAGEVEAMVQVRHRAPPKAAQVRYDKTGATVEFHEPVQAVAPGQAAVFYRGDEVLGGGFITTTEPA